MLNIILSSKTSFYLAYPRYYEMVSISSSPIASAIINDGIVSLSRVTPEGYIT
jgi:hypothetical protein